MKGKAQQPQQQQQQQQHKTWWLFMLRTWKLRFVVHELCVNVFLYFGRPTRFKRDFRFHLPLSDRMNEWNEWMACSTFEIGSQQQ